MGEGEEEGKKASVTIPWPEWHKQLSKMLSFELGQIVVAKGQNSVVDFSWIEGIVRRETAYVDILNDLHETMVDVQTDVRKLKDMLGPLEPYLPALKRHAEEQERLDEERERLR
jgi:hypothetical protein